MSAQKARKKPFITGKLVARWPHINTPDDKFGGTPRYKCDLFIDDDSVELIDQIKEAGRDWHGNKKVTLPIQDDKETGQTYVKTWSYNQPLVVDSEGNPIPPSKLPLIRMGSQVMVKGNIAENTHPQPGVRLELTVLKICELAEANNIPDEFKTVEGSYIAEHDDEIVEDMPNETVEKPKASKAANF